MRAANILHLGRKELASLARDPMMVFLIVYAFTFAIYTAATAMPETLNKAPIAVVDEDRSQLSERIVDALQPPHFMRPERVAAGEVDARMDAGRVTFALYIPAGFERDVLAGRAPALQLAVDATRMSQAFTGSGHLQSVVAGEVGTFLARHREVAAPPIALVLRVRYNPELSKSSFGAINELIGNVTMLAIVLTGAALIREREHGTVEHLLAMPVTPFEIMSAKVWAMALVVLLAAGLALVFVVEGLLGVRTEGSLALFLAGTALHLFATTALGIFLATVARSMPQFGLLLLLVLLPLEILSGGMTPRESMPVEVRTIMLAAPTTHFVILAQAILFRDAGWDVVWPQFAALLAIGGVLFWLSLARFRRMLGAAT